MKNRLFVNNNTIILFLFIIGSILFIELNFRYWYRFLEQYMMFVSIFPLSVLQHTTERTVLWRNWWFSCMVVDNE